MKFVAGTMSDFYVDHFQDPLPTRLLKQCLDQILPFITRLINMSLVSGVVPADFKTTIIRPLLKKPNLDPDILKNY